MVDYKEKGFFVNKAGGVPSLSRRNLVVAFLALRLGVLWVVLAGAGVSVVPL